MDELVTAEFYEDAALETLVGAVDIYKRHMTSQAREIGLRLARFRQAEGLHVVLIDKNGEEAGRFYIASGA